MVPKRCWRCNSLGSCDVIGSGFPTNILIKVKTSTQSVRCQFAPRNKLLLSTKSALVQMSHGLTLQQLPKWSVTQHFRATNLNHKWKGYRGNVQFRSSIALESATQKVENRVLNNVLCNSTTGHSLPLFFFVPLAKLLRLSYQCTGNVPSLYSTSVAT